MQSEIPTRLLAKLASLAAHADEYTSPGSSELDARAIRGLVEDPEVQELIKSLGALVPMKREEQR